jgi:acetyl-CoA acetyltransferase
VKNLPGEIAVVGIGETEYVRKSDRSMASLVIEAVQKALEDAKISPQEVDGFVTDGIFSPTVCPHNELAYNLGIKYRYHDYVDDTAASVPSPYYAATAITLGRANVVLTYYTSAYPIWGGNRIYGMQEIAMKPSFERPYGVTMASFFGMFAHRYMHDRGITRSQLTRYLGSIAVNQRRNAILNGRGQMKKPLSYEEYENSPIVVDPLKLPDFPVLTYGANAWVMTSAERARNCPHVPVYFTGYGYACDPIPDFNYPLHKDKSWYLHFPFRGLSLDRALQMADISRGDLDFAEIYEPCTIILLADFENFGFCKEGEAGSFAESEISLEGSLPINTHGGHLSHSFMNANSHMVEAVRQLRGEAGACQVRDAKIGMISAGSGWWNNVTILRAG